MIVHRETPRPYVSKVVMVVYLSQLIHIHFTGSFDLITTQAFVVRLKMRIIGTIISYYPIYPFLCKTLYPKHRFTLEGAIDVSVIYSDYNISVKINQSQIILISCECSREIYIVMHSWILRESYKLRASEVFILKSKIHRYFG